MTAEATVHPQRFRAAPERSARLARPLRLIARLKTVDEPLLDRIGRQMLARDEVGAELAEAMRRRDRHDPERVTSAQFKQALRQGVDTVPDAPPALRRFFAVVDEVPAWVDFDLLERGGRASRRFGRTASDVLTALSLIGGYRFGGPGDLLVETGALIGPGAMRRLGETQQWTTTIAEPGAMRRFGEGFRLTVHVRAMHALVNHEFERNGRWDVRRWGLPINKSDQAVTLGLFNSTQLIGARALGWIVTGEESRAIMHLWKYVGWLIGVDEEWLFDTEREQNVFNYHAVCAQSDVTAAGPALAGALVDGQRTLQRGRLSDLRGRYARLRLLSLLRYFLGKESLRDLGLPATPAWAVPPIVALNLLKSGLIARSRPGRRLLERAGDRFIGADRRLLLGEGPESFVNR